MDVCRVHAGIVCTGMPLKVWSVDIRVHPNLDVPMTVAYVLNYTRIQYACVCARTIDRISTLYAWLAPILQAVHLARVSIVVIHMNLKREKHLAHDWILCVCEISSHGVCCTAHSVSRLCPGN